mmetsp:Transcript_108735/g.347031  ORF Transcript_108735/g.347031 Transcript_108735/m.347031 type:complete len:201 (-) Transcript_108735:1097-1699(-)
MHRCNLGVDVHPIGHPGLRLEAFHQHILQHFYGQRSREQQQRPEGLCAETGFDHRTCDHPTRCEDGCHAKVPRVAHRLLVRQVQKGPWVWHPQDTETLGKLVLHQSLPMGTLRKVQDERHAQTRDPVEVCRPLDCTQHEECEPAALSDRMLEADHAAGERDVVATFVVSPLDPSPNQVRHDKSVHVDEGELHDGHNDGKS